MLEYRLTVEEDGDFGRLIRMVHVDDLCAAIWDIQQELIREANHGLDETQQNEAYRWAQRLAEILDETGAQIAMRYYE